MQFQFWFLFETTFSRGSLFLRDLGFFLFVCMCQLLGCVFLVQFYVLYLQCTLSILVNLLRFSLELTSPSTPWVLEKNLPLLRVLSLKFIYWFYLINLIESCIELLIFSVFDLSLDKNWVFSFKVLIFTTVFVLCILMTCYLGLNISRCLYFHCGIKTFTISVPILPG